jgi:hypothetical protein
MEWQRPVTLNFGGQGAEFWTAAGAADFTLSNLPAARTLYDVTDPLSPVITPLSGAGATASFTQADGAAPRHYALANLAAPTLPTVAAHSATNFGNVLAADALYIGPASFKEELQPLLDLRTRQGYTPLFVDVQAIFDVYGDGYSAAPAIRNFLRARSDWQNPNRNISVVLAGDGTYDPFNYKNTGFGSGVSHPIPPYMADVDIYINEAPCETCFAQLHGDDPITGDEPDARDPEEQCLRPGCLAGTLPGAQRGRTDDDGRQDRRLREARPRRPTGAPANCCWPTITSPASTRRIKSPSIRQATSPTTQMKLYNFLGTEQAPAARLLRSLARPPG